MAANSLQITLEARNLSTRAFQQLTKDLERVQKGSDAAGVSVKKSGQDIDAGLKQIGGAGASAVGGLIEALGVALPLSAAAAATAIAAIGVDSVQSFMALDRGLREVNTLFGLSGEAARASFQEINTGVRELSQRLGVDAVESTKALYQAISASVPRENALSFLEIATKAAIGGVTDTKTAVDGLSTVINAFKLPMSDAQRVADVMFTTVKLGKTTFEELSRSMFQVAPLASSAGLSFEETAAAIAALTQQGVPTAESMTRVRDAIQAIIKPSAEAEKVAEALGLEFNASALQANGLKNTFDDIHEATGGDIEILGKLFGSVEGLGAVLSLTGEKAGDFARAIGETENAAGSATLAYEEMARDGGRSFEELGAKINELKLQLGEKLLPVAKDVVTVVDLIGQKLGLWPTTPPPADQIERFNKLALAANAAASALSVVWEALTNLKPIQQVAIERIGQQVGAALKQADAALKQAAATDEVRQAQHQLDLQLSSGTMTADDYANAIAALQGRMQEAAAGQARLQEAVLDETRVYAVAVESVGDLSAAETGAAQATTAATLAISSSGRERIAAYEAQQKAAQVAASEAKRAASAAESEAKRAANAVESEAKRAAAAAVREAERAAEQLARGRQRVADETDEQDERRAQHTADTLRKIEDAETNHAEKMADLARDGGEKRVEITERAADRITREETETADRLRRLSEDTEARRTDIARDWQQRRTDLVQEHADRRRDLEQRLVDDLKRFDDDLARGRQRSEADRALELKFRGEDRQLARDERERERQREIARAETELGTAKTDEERARIRKRLADRLDALDEQQRDEDARNARADAREKERLDLRARFEKEDLERRRTAIETSAAAQINALDTTLTEELEKLRKASQEKLDTLGGEYAKKKALLDKSLEDERAAIEKDREDRLAALETDIAKRAAKLDEEKDKNIRRFKAEATEKLDFLENEYRKRLEKIARELPVLQGELDELIGRANEQVATIRAQISSAGAAVADAGTSWSTDRAINPFRGGNGAVPMAVGGAGMASKPTLFLAGERGPEPFAFGEAALGGRNGQAGAITVPITVYGNVYGVDDMEDLVVAAVVRAQRRGRLN